MYETFFGLTSKPFDLLPNPYFLFLSKSHKKALTYLDNAIRERTGFILLTGEIGSGKERAPDVDEIKGLLTGILHRIETLEKMDTEHGGKTIEDIGQRLEQSDQAFRDNMRTLAKDICELKKDLLAKKNSDAISPSSPEGEGERKKGFFGKLFRAV